MQLLIRIWQISFSHSNKVYMKTWSNKVPLFNFNFTRFSLASLLFRFLGSSLPLMQSNPTSFWIEFECGIGLLIKELIGLLPTLLMPESHGLGASWELGLCGELSFNRGFFSSGFLLCRGLSEDFLRLFLERICFESFFGQESPSSKRSDSFIVSSFPLFEELEVVSIDRLPMAIVVAARQARQTSLFRRMVDSCVINRFSFKYYWWQFLTIDWL